MTAGCGVLLPVFSLPATGGIGDFGEEAYRFADLLANHGIRYWQILPLNPGNPQNGESPYFSVSAFAINPLLISLEKLQSTGWLTAAELKAMPEISARRIDYDSVRAAKLPLLAKAAARFDAHDAGFGRFCETNRHWLDDAALFDVLRTYHTDRWTDWPLGLRDRDPRALADFADAHQDELQVHRIMQYFAWMQWQALRQYCQAKNISIVGDLPIYVAQDSADTWSHPDLFLLDADRKPVAVSGVPPDFFSATGQLWNNPVYRWEAHQAKNFSWWIRRLRHLFALYDIVRIDHFRGLVQYWSIPAGESTAVNGAWKDAPVHALLDAFTSAFRPFPVICEDLGIITDDVRAVMKQYGLPGMKILQFAFSDDDSQNPYLPANYDRRCWVYTGTHDNLPTLGWLRTTGQEERQRIAALVGRESADGETVWDLIALALKSPAAVAVFPLQDLLTLDETSRINNPARPDGNWRWRWQPDLEPPQPAFQRFKALAAKFRQPPRA